MKPPQKFLYPRLPFVLIALAALGGIAWLLYQAPSEVPMGDAYIHFVYARNLAWYGELAFNIGLDEGIGTTSLLWVLLLTGLQIVGVEPVIAAKLLGTLLLILSGWLVYDIVLGVIPARFGGRRMLLATAAGLLTVLPGNNLWLALSGMETVLFLTLGLAALTFYRRERWVMVGIALGLLALTRIEGPLLAGVIVLVEFVRHRKVPRMVYKMILPMALILLPWLAYLQWREGVPITTSYQGKQTAFTYAKSVFETLHPSLAWVVDFSLLIFVVSWLGYVLFFMLGSGALPGPILSVAGQFSADQFTMPVLGLFVVGLFVLPLLFLVTRWMWNFRYRLAFAKPAHRIGLVFLGWMAGQNLLYAVVLPNPGAGGRYIPMNHLALWGGMLFGILLIKTPNLRRIAALALVVLVGASLAYWRDVYISNIEYMEKVRLPAIVYVDENVAADESVGSMDLGPLRYYARQPVVDLFGFVNKDVIEHLDEGGDFVGYLSQAEICHLFLFSPADTSGAWVDPIQFLGLADDTALHIVHERDYAMTLEEWLIGSQAVNNYMPGVSVIRLDWQSGAVCGDTQASR